MLILKRRGCFKSKGGHYDQTFDKGASYLSEKLKELL